MSVFLCLIVERVFMRINVTLESKGCSSHWDDIIDCGSR